MTIKTKIILALLLSISTSSALTLSQFIIFPPNASAQPNVTGEIDLESDTASQLSYEDIQKQAIDFTQLVLNNAKAAASGATPNMSRPSQVILNYLNDAYLYCTVVQGTCPSILDSILEFEVMQGAFANDSSCSSMKEFWRLWISADREKRLSYKIKTGFAAVTTDFRKNTRPKYIKCEESVKSVTSENQDIKGIMKSRYFADSPILKSLEAAPKILNEIAIKVPDVHKYTLKSN